MTNKSILKKVFVVTSLLFTFFFFLFTSPAVAASEFSTDFVTTYSVDTNGTTQVDQDITLTNKISNVYATEYALEIGSTRLEDIKVQTIDHQEIPHQITQTENTTAIALTFPDKVVGKNQSHHFTISYTNHDVAVHNGKVLEVNIPKVNNIDDINSFSIKLLVPQYYGQPSVVTPKTYQYLQQGNYNLLVFDKNAITTRGITALFGDQQVFDFNLKYHLENTTVNDGITQIALPPDTPYQKLYYQSLDPEPLSISQDGDGNWLATYTIKPKERLDVTATGQAVLYLKPTIDLPHQNADLSLYLTEQPYWPVNDPQIKELAASLKTPQAIYQYLVDNFSYDYSRLDTSIDRLGALKAIQSPGNVICQEFTDTFITLARAAGIPARELNGFAYTENSKLRPLSLVQDVLHSWPEYYDATSKNWIPVDPTWGNTTGGVDYFSTLDLNHFVFVIHGLNSSTPYPAGYYKLEDVNSKDVLVTFSSTEPVPTTNISSELEPNPLGLLGFPISQSLHLHNHSNIAFYHTSVDLASQDFVLTSPQQLSIDTLLPFTSTTLSLKLKPPTLLPVASGSITIILLNQTFVHQLQTITHQQLIYLCYAVLATITALIATLTWRLLVHRYKQHRALRRQSQEPEEPDHFVPPDHSQGS